MREWPVCAMRHRPARSDTRLRASAFSRVALCGAVLQPVIAARQYVIPALEIRAHPITKVELTSTSKEIKRQEMYAKFRIRQNRT
jgi:hypothetical protein